MGYRSRLGVGSRPGIACVFVAAGTLCTIFPAKASVVDIVCKSQDSPAPFDYWIDTSKQTVTWLWTDPQTGASSLLSSQVSITNETYSWTPFESIRATVYRATGILVVQNFAARPQIANNSKCELGSKPVPTPNPHPAPKL
jgi:hypothetical protein